MDHHCADCGGNSFVLYRPLPSDFGPVIGGAIDWKKESAQEMRRKIIEFTALNASFFLWERVCLITSQRLKENVQCEHVLCLTSAW